jgi:hypothetical protein
MGSALCRLHASRDLCGSSAIRTPLQMAALGERRDGPLGFWVSGAIPVMPISALAVWGLERRAGRRRKDLLRRPPH